MSWMDAIRSATVDAAELLGWSDRVGAIAPGRFADLIAVPGELAEDLGNLTEVSFVMKGGTVVRP
jgi:imidazolonepropionase-like amidohydrolase